MTKFINLLRKLRDDQSGSSAIEYALIAAGVGGVLVAALPAIETGITNTFGNIATFLQ